MAVNGASPVEGKVSIFGSRRRIFSAYKAGSYTVRALFADSNFSSDVGAA
jgi:hypothetical protein